MEDIPLGLAPHELFRDLRFIKLSPRERGRVVYLQGEFKNRHLALHEEQELRRIYNRHSVAIAELKKAEQSARVSLAKEARGHKHIAGKLREASTVGAQRQQEELTRLRAELAELEREERDFGI